MANDETGGISAPGKESGNDLIYTGKYAMQINQAAIQNGISPFLIAAVIKAESGFNPNAKSGVGARGLMQLMPETAKWLGVKNVLNPDENIAAGSKYLAQQIKSFGSIELGLAAYNAGPGNVRKYKGIPPFKETQAYVKKVMYYYKDKTFPSGSGEGSSGFDLDLGFAKDVLMSPVLWVTVFVYYLFKG